MKDKSYKRHTLHRHNKKVLESKLPLRHCVIKINWCQRMYPHKLEADIHYPVSSTLKDRVDKRHHEIIYPFLHDVMFSSFPVPNIFIDLGISQEPNGKENSSKGDSSYK